MDPNAAAEALAQAIEDGDTESAQEALEDLRAWRHIGGFAPRDGWPAGV